jgi:dimethylargininase
VDLELARRQHRLVVAALRDCGLAVFELPPDPERPDAVFVADPLLLVGTRAFLAAAAAPSRAGEAEALLEALRGRFEPVLLEPPATLDGGDVLIAGDTLYVGRSSRTNQAACDQLALQAGRRVIGVPVPEGMLHLLTGCSYLGDDRVLTVEALADAFSDFETIVLPKQEEAAANVLAHGRRVLVAAGYPRTVALLERAGFEVRAVSITEFEKRDGGISCLALLY